MEVLILLLVFSFSVEKVHGLENRNIDMVLRHNAQKKSEHVDYKMKISKNCSVSPVSHLLRHDIKQKLDAGVKLIIMHLSFINHTGTLPGEMESDIYKPFYWERTTGRHGQGLLFLKRSFEILSLSTLTLGTETMDIELQEDPIGCLLQRNIEEIEVNIRRILLNDFQEISLDGSGGSLNSNENVCNLHIKNVNNRAVFYHVCCHKTIKGDIACSELVKDIWVQILFYCIYFMNFIAIMFCPYLIPKSWYKIKYQTLAYNVRFTNEIGTIKILKQSKPNKTDYLDISELSAMKNFEKHITTNMKENDTKACRISKLCLRVKPDRLIPPNDVPVGILESLYGSILRCRIRKMESFSECCESSICGPLAKLCPNYKTPTWYSCFKKVMFVITGVFIVTPWVLRILIFYKFENAELETKEQQAKERNLEVHFAFFPGCLVSFLTPMHVLFVVCYVALLIDLILFGILGLCLNIKRKRFLAWEIKQNIESVVRKCFRDMHGSSFRDSFGWATRILLYPFKRYGISAFFFVGIYWVFLLPVCIIVLCFYCIPTLNIFVRLVSHLIVILIPGIKLPKLLLKRNGKFLRKQKIARLPEHSTRSFRCFQFITILLCLLAMVSTVVLAVEVFVFFVEIFIYTLIGIILNAAQTLKFVSLLFMLSLYARECFGSVNKKYQIFNQAINKALLEKARTEVDAIAWQPEDKQPCTAFQIKMDDHGSNKTSTAQKIFVSEGILKTKIARVLLFLDNQDKPFISRNFFFKVAYLNHEGCPGSLFKNLCQALRQFCIIILFLLFVIVVVMAFGNEYSMSGFNQMLATLAGGFLPWMFRNVLFKPPTELEIDISSVSFSNFLNEVIRSYTEVWPVADIDFDADIPNSTDPTSNDNNGDTDSTAGDIPNSSERMSNENDDSTDSTDEIIIKTYEQEHKSNEIEMC